MKYRPDAALAMICFLLAAAPASRAAAAVTGVRLLAVAKGEATLAVDLDAPGSVSVSWGENPGAWAESSESTASETHHQLLIPHLSPDTQYFYSLSVDGAPQPDMYTFRSGRSWVTRRASLLITADVPPAAPAAASAAEAALAERLFAEESDALIVLGETPVDPVALHSLHARSMAERVVAAADAASALKRDVADVRVVTDGALPGTDDGNCWRVALGERAPAGAEVIVHRGARSSIAVVGDSVRVTLADPGPADDGGPRTYLRLDFAEGRLVATLRGADGATLGEAKLARDCRAPAPKETAHAAHSADGEDEAATSDGDADVSDCVTK